MTGHQLAAVALLGAVASVGADTLASAHYAAPVERYGHFALGRPHEYAGLVALTSAGRTLRLTLPEDEVFEDLAPRRVQLTPGAAPEWLTIVSQRLSGARLALVGLLGDRLAITAQSAPIGTSMRWLNPVGVADLDGDGQAEIAAVLTPHIGGTLKVYRRQGQDLVEAAALEGFSNHVYGSAELALSAALRIQGRMQLLVPDAARRTIRAVEFIDGRLRESARWPLPESATGPLRSDPDGTISVGLASGVRHRWHVGR